MLYVKETDKTVDSACKAIVEAAAALKFGVLGEHNLREKMAAKGVTFERECRVIEVCNPQQAKKALEANMAIANALPCRICVYEEQGKVNISTIKPTFLLDLFNASDARNVAREVEDAMLQIIDNACG